MAVSELPGREPGQAPDCDFAPVLRRGEGSQAREYACEQGREVTGTGVPASVPTDGGTEGRITFPTAALEGLRS